MARAELLHTLTILMHPHSRRPAGGRFRISQEGCRSSEGAGDPGD